MKSILYLGVACAVTCVLAGLSGCTKNTPNNPPGNAKGDGDGKPQAAAGSKLAKAVIGTWAKDNVSYAFRESGDYSYKGGDLSLKGKWKALDEKTVELTFTLTKAEVDLMKPIFEVTKKGIDAVNDAAKKASEASGGFIKFDPIPAPPEPKEGDNTWKETIVIKDADTLEISKVPYIRRLGTWGPFQQTGRFVAQVAGTGEIYFPLSYAEPPDVELKRFAGPNELKITELTVSGFKWTHIGKNKAFGNPEMTFIANGIPREKDQTPFEQAATFKVTPGASGEEKFPHAYASPPHVELSTKIGLHKVLLTKTTATGFSWRNEGTDKFFDTREINYIAKGLKAN